MFESRTGLLLAMIDALAERSRESEMTLQSIGHVARKQPVDNDAEYLASSDMLAELREDNKALAGRLRTTPDLCAEHRDIATAGLIEPWIDETEQRIWLLFETSRRDR